MSQYYLIYFGHFITNMKIIIIKAYTILILFINILSENLIQVFSDDFDNQTIGIFN